jgi:hypothetical protein
MFSPLRYKTTLALLATVAISATAHAQSWDQLLDTNDWLASWSHMSAFDDGSVALVSRDYLPNYAGAGIFVRTYQNGTWAPTERIDAGMPSYNGRTAEVMGRVFVGAAEKSALGASPLFVIASARYSRTVLDADGLMYALFLKKWDGYAWSSWVRITPVGIVNDVSADVDSQGLIWYTWNDGDNRFNGTYRVTSYDPSTSSTGAVHVLDNASRTLTWRSTSVVIAPDAIWVSYRAPDGIYARRLANNGAGPLEPRMLVQSGFASGQSAAFADGTLWVTTDSPLRLYRHDCGAFVQETIGGLSPFYEETESSIESVDYYLPVVAPRPNGGLVLLTVQHHHFEDWFDSYNDFDIASLISSDRSTAGVWSYPVTIDPDESWSEIGNSVSNTGAGLFIAGTKASGGLFVYQRP